MPPYKHIFFDLDRTLWDFEQNMRITLTDIYENHNLKKASPSQIGRASCRERV